MISGIGVANIGHSHPDVISAVHEQVDSHMHLMVYGEFIQQPQVQLCKLLVENSPEDLNCVYITNSGTEATEGALKLAKRVTLRSEIIAAKNSYHGNTMGSMSVSGVEKPFIPLSTISP